MGFCSYIQNPVRTLRCQTLGTRISGVHLALCLLFAVSKVTIFTTPALRVLTFTHPVLRSLHRPAHLS